MPDTFHPCMLSEERMEKTVMDQRTAKLLERFSGEEIIVHPRRDEAFPALNENELAVVFKNPVMKEKDLFLFADPDYFTIVFGDWSYQWPNCEEQYWSLEMTIDVIMNHGAYVYSIRDDQYDFTILVWKNQIYLSGDDAIKFPSVFMNTQFLHNVEQGNFKESRLYWDSALEPVI